MIPTYINGIAVAYVFTAFLPAFNNSDAPNILIKDVSLINV